jgi:hypothetical protein
MCCQTYVRHGCVKQHVRSVAAPKHSERSGNLDAQHGIIGIIEYTAFLVNQFLLIQRTGTYTLGIPLGSWNPRVLKDPHMQSFWVPGPWVPGPLGNPWES